MTRKESIALIHKEAIAYAAKTLFQLKGVGATTMDEIAREAAYSKATLYVYFSSKEDLLNYLALQGMTQLEERISHVIESEEDALDQYRHICQELVAFSESEPLLFGLTTEKIAFGEQRDDPTLNEIYQRGERINDCIEAALRNGIEQGHFSDGLQLLPTGFFLWATLAGLIRMASNKDEYIQHRMGLDKDGFLELSFQTLLRSLLRCETTG